MVRFYTLVQFFLNNTGIVGDHRSFLIPDKNVTPLLAAMLDKFHGAVDEDVSFRDQEALFAAVQECGVECEGGLVRLQRGGVITRMCQLFYVT